MEQLTRRQQRVNTNNNTTQSSIVFVVVLLETRHGSLQAKVLGHVSFWAFGLRL